MDIEKDFEFKGLPDIEILDALKLNPLGHLRLLPGVWKGQGFNQIWRPFHPTVPPDPANQDRFLELNLTQEKLEFSQISGAIPNRGLRQPDINLFGVHYLQQIKDKNLGAGIHIEPGIWINVGQTTNPAEAPTVVRMASIPHGTTIEAQGDSNVFPNKPVIAPVSVTPFVIGNPAALVPFPESTLATPTQFRSPPAQLAGINQGMVDNPNSVLSAVILPQNIIETTVLNISTKIGVVPAPDAGGGAANIAFLTGVPSPLNANALAAEMDATFWIETVKEPSGKTFHQLQYTQRVLLNFNGLSWPHVSVATLRKI